MAPRKSTPSKIQCSGATSSRRPTPIHFPGGRAYLPRVPVQPIILPKKLVPHFQCVLQLHYLELRLEKALCTPAPGVASVVWEFHSNLPFKVGTTVFVRGKWVEFGAQAINRIYRLLNDNSAEYRALFAETDYEPLM